MVLLCVMALAAVGNAGSAKALALPGRAGLGRGLRPRAVALAEGGEEVVVFEVVVAEASKFFLLWTFCISDKKDFWGGPTIGLVGF